jgi:hypothetical protein
MTTQSPLRLFVEVSSQHNSSLSIHTIYSSMEITTKERTVHKPKHVTTPQKLGESLSNDQLQNLFVEMCFFARLGCVQPPSCLPCAYNQVCPDASETTHLSQISTEKQETKCTNLVVWRINANTSHLLHPDKLKGNLLVLTCCTARKLMNGESVQTMKWDGKNKKLVVM